VLGFEAIGQGNNTVTLGDGNVAGVYMGDESQGTVYCAGVVVTTGINFPDDASASPSADVNTLDNYEEGTWTATVTDGTTSLGFSANDCAYIKIGKLVFISGRLVCNNLNGTSSGLVRITNLPFATNSQNYGVSAISIGYLAGMSIEDNVSVVIRPADNSTVGNFHVWDGTDSDNTTALTATEMSSNGQFQFGGTYPANA
jgi:hypothetical protein